jgi:hypothetical protein
MPIGCALAFCTGAQRAKTAKNGNGREIPAITKQ